MSLENAKSLRKNMTDAEIRLWYRLRAHRFDDVKFKRQVPIGPYIADFVAITRRLIVEVDGGQHGGTYDRIRSRWLRTRLSGVAVLERRGSTQYVGRARRNL